MKAHCTVLLLVALSLGGCCLSGSGCDAPLMATAPMATTTSNLDGFAPSPAEEPSAPAPKQRGARRSRGQGGEPGSVYSDPNMGNEYDDAEARLKRKLIICQGCAVSGN
jgi:hypothetical protein